jgi:tetratricopeptide (TPR) repeat protein
MFATHTSRRIGRRRTATALLVLAAGMAACGTDAERSAVERGDAFFAADSLDQALAEYQLAARQGGDGDPRVLARVAHTYTALGRVDQAAVHYLRAAESDPGWADQGAVDLMHLAREAEARGDRFLMATAVSRALELKPGLGLGDMALPLARHFFRDKGEYGRALPLYQKALVRNDTTADVLFEVGQAYQEIGDCAQGLFFFERFREVAPRSRSSDASWYIGTCSFELARGLREQADRAPEPDALLLEEALEHVERTLEVGEPRNLLGLTWFERGEILAALGDCEGALDSFQQVRRVENSPNAAISARALERIDLLRFGRGLDRFRDGGTCY